MGWMIFMKTAPMRTVCLLCCLLISSLTFAQNRWSFALDIQAGISGKKDADRREFRDAENILTSTYDYGQTRGPSFAGGVTAGFRVFPFLEIRSGLYYQGEQTGWYNQSLDVRPASSPANNYRNDYQLQTHRLEAPVSLRLRLLGKSNVSVRPFIDLGARPGWFLAGEYVTTTQTGREEGKTTAVYHLLPKKHDQRFSTPIFIALGMESRRVSVSLSLQQASAFSYGVISRDWLCCIEAPYDDENTYVPYIERPEYNYSLMATISYRLF